MWNVQIQISSVSERRIVNDFRAWCGDVARSLICLLSLTGLNLRVDFQGGEYLVTHSIVVQGQWEVPFNVHSLHLAHEWDPLEKTTSLQAQEAEDSGISLLFPLHLLHICDSLQVSEPSASDHKLLYLLRLFALEPSSCVQAESIESFPLKTQVDRIGADLPVELEFFLYVGVVHDRPECSKHEQVSHRKQWFGEIRSFI